MVSENDHFNANKFAVIDATNPASMSIESEPTLTSNGPWDLFSYYGYLFAAHNTGLDVWDVQTDPTNPTKIDTVTLSGTGYFVHASGNYIWFLISDYIVPIEIVLV